MAQHDYVIANGTGAAVRSDLNNALAAIVSQNSGATAPSTTYAYQWWADTTTGLLKLRNAANNAWITLFQLDGEWSTLAVENGSAAAPSIYFKDSGTDTGIYSPGTDQVAISTGGTGRLFVDASGNIGLGTSSATNFANYQTLTLNDTAGSFVEFKVNGTASHGIVADGSSLLIKSISNLPVIFGTNDVERMRLTSTGLGIGTATPGYKLDVTGGGIGVNTTGGTSASIVFNQSGIGVAEIGIPANENALQFRGYNGATVVERARIDSSGRLLVGTSSARSNFYNDTNSAFIQLESASNDGSALALVQNFNANTLGGQLILAKSNAASVGSNTLVASGDACGRVSFQGSDGAQFVEAAQIRCDIDGTPGANDMPGRLVFSTTADGASSPTERMRITQGGALKFSSNGTYGNSTSAVNEFYQTNNATALNARAANGSFNDSVLTLDADRNTSNNTFYFSRFAITGVAYRFQVADSGNVTNTNNSYGAISDIKLKEHIVDASSQWDDLKALKVRKYNFKEETGQPTHNQIGLIAQEVELVSPGLVSQSPDFDEDGNDLGTVTKSVNYSVLYMKAVKALQEAMERIETLEAKVAALEAS